MIKWFSLVKTLKRLIVSVHSRTYRISPTKGVYRNRKQTCRKLTLEREALVVVDPSHQTASESLEKCSFENLSYFRQQGVFIEIGNRLTEN